MWWYFLVSVSVINILGWIWTRVYILKKPNATLVNWRTRNLIWLAAAYVFGCAFRSVLPRADVQRICLFDTWFSNVFVGRSVATVAELSYVIQWAIVLNMIAQLTQSKFAERISYIMVPLIFIAECFSWYAVTTTRYLGNTCEESLWAVTYTLLALALLTVWPKTKGALKYAVSFTIIGCILYVFFMTNVDVPMYFNRWRADVAAGKPILGLVDGVVNLLTHWTVTHDIKDWHDEIPWMSLYFSFGVWASILLCYVPMTQDRLGRYLKNATA